MSRVDVPSRAGMDGEARRDAMGRVVPASRLLHEHRHHEGDTPTHPEMIHRWVWRDFVNVILGVWLASSPATIGYLRTDPWLAGNDIASGVLIVVLASLAMLPRFDLLRWGVCAVGLWLLVAPLVFWSTSAGAYANDTLVGSLVIAFSVLVPMMPGKAHHALMNAGGPATPPGWSYNPSDWTQRGPIIAMALVGFFLSRYLAAFQLGHLQSVWDSFFGDGTRRVLESKVSRAWPVSDAGLGAASYMVEALSGFMGGRDRWRSMPWMVVMFGVLVIPLGVVSIVLVVLQPVAVGAWCTLCLVTAGAMLIMISPAIDEVVAMCQFMAAAKRQGAPFWKTFWLGGTLESDQPEATPAAEGDLDTIYRRSIGALDLNNVPWNMLVSTAAGLWLMASPAVLGVTGAASDSAHLVGALVVVFSVIAYAEVARPARFVNVLLGLWICVSPWLLDGDTGVSRWSTLGVGVVLIAMAWRRGRIEQRFGSWNRYLV